MLDHLPQTTEFATGLRFVEVPDDHLVPDLRPRDFILMEPVNRYDGEGIYLLKDALGGTQIYRCHACGKPSSPQIYLGCDNVFYPSDSVTPEVFAEHVIGKAVMKCKVLDHRLSMRQPIAA